MKKIILISISIFLGCAGKNHTQSKIFECEGVVDSAWVKELKILNMGFKLEDIHDIKLNDNNGVIRLYVVRSFEKESFYQAIYINDTITKIEYRTPISTSIMDDRTEITKDKKGRIISYRPRSYNEYLPSVKVGINNEVPLDKLSILKIIMNLNEVENIKNVFTCDELGNKYEYRDGDQFFFEYRKGNIYKFVSFHGGKYLSTPYLKIMELFN